MTKNFIFKLLSLALSLSLTASLFVLSASAYSGDANLNGDELTASTRSVSNERARVNMSVKGISKTGLWNYTSVPIVYNGKALGLKAYMINGTYYMPLRNFISAATDMKSSYSSATRTTSVWGESLNLSASDGSYVIYANDRALFDTTPAKIMSDGRMYIPARTLAKALGLRMTVSSHGLSLDGKVTPLLHASRYYDPDSVLWLSRIISAESRGEPLLGQIAVGNVIINRTRSRDFPNTIWGVIFDRKYGIQFSPVANGTIYNTPTYSATLAAKIALEGFTLSDEILYFLAPKHASSSWIVSSRDYAFTIQNHEFYA